MKLLPACPVCETRETRFFARVEHRDYWRCERCAATYLDPQQLPLRSVEHAHYRLHRNEVGDARYRRFLSRLADPLLARLPPRCFGLDYGCGRGPALVAMLVEAGHRMSVYDPLFFPDASALGKHYDFITCTETAEHFHRPAAEFVRLSGLLRGGGWLAVMTAFQPDDAAFADWHYRRDPTHVVFYGPATFRVIAERHGLSCEIPSRDVALLRSAARSVVAPV